MISATKKSRAMMAARILSDVGGASIINSALIRSAIVAANALNSWIDDSDPTDEVFSSGTFAIRMLETIESHARGMESVPVEIELIGQLLNHRRRMHVVLRRKLKMRKNNNQKGEQKQDAKNSKKPVKEEDVVEQKYISIFCARGLESDDDEEEESVQVEDAVPKRLPEDLRRCRLKASGCSVLLWVCFLVILITGALSTMFVFQLLRHNHAEVLQKNVTLELARVAEEALEELSTAVENPLGSASEAIGLLENMASASKSIGHEMYFNGENYLTEYRVAIQDFTRQNMVTSVLTPRLFGGICQMLKTVFFHPENDVFADQKVVFYVLTPNDCDNDAIPSGVFSAVTPSFLRYTSADTNYRRRECRVGAFYSNEFGFSVALTRDRLTLQDTVVPPNTKFGKDANIIDSSEKSAEFGFILWIIIGIVISACCLFLVITWMMVSKFRYRTIFFPVLVGVIVFVTVLVSTVCSQMIEDAIVENTVLINLISLVETITAALLSPTILDNNLALGFTGKLCTGTFKGRLAWTDPSGSAYYPPEMASLMEAIDAPTIASFRRGQYGAVTDGYAIASVYVESVNLNLFLVQEVPHWNEMTKGIGIAGGLGAAAALITFIFLEFTFLSHLRSHAFGLPILRYYVAAENVRYVLYGLLFVINIVGVIVTNMYSCWRVHSSVLNGAEMSLVLLSACLRVGSIGDTCTTGCGVPDFIAMLYFFLENDENAEYPTIQVIENGMPLPFPENEDWEANYLGAELSMSGIRTTLLNVPSFATPLVNETWDGLNPRFVVRNMLSTSILNETHGFCTERFPESFFPSKFRFEVYSIGFAIFFCLSLFLITFLEWRYLHLHYLWTKKKCLRSQYITIGVLLIMLPMLCFLLHGLVIKNLLQRAFERFIDSELKFLLNSVSYRLTLLTLEKYTFNNQEDLISFLAAIVSQISNNAMKDGTRYLRFRLSYEAPERGSGRVSIPGLGSGDTTLNIGNLDSGASFPQCALSEGLSLSQYTSGNMYYCYQEIPQKSDSVLSTPRIFLLALMSYDEWVTDEVRTNWSLSLRATMLIAATVVMVLAVVAFITLDIARSGGFPLSIKEQETMFYDPVPLRFTIENFIPRSHQLLWMFFFIMIGIIVVYFTTSIGILVQSMDEASEVWLAADTQSQALTSLRREVEYDSYNFLIYPFPEETYDKLADLYSSSLANTLEYRFLTTTGSEEFELGVRNIYNNFSSASDSMGAKLLSAKAGVGSVATLISKQYQEIFITQQENAFKHLDTFSERMQVGITSYSLGGQYSTILDILVGVLELGDYMKKIFILDQMVINSFATLTPSTPSFWPFTGEGSETQEADILAKARPAAASLTETVRSLILKLGNYVEQISSDPSDAKGALDLVSSTFSLSVALNLISNSIWTLQNERQLMVSAIYITGNEEEEKAEKVALRAVIEDQDRLFTLSENAELSYRKTQQMVEYLDDDVPINYFFTALPWQRVFTVEGARAMIITAFIVTALCFIACSVSAMAFILLAREQTIMMYREWYEDLQDSFVLYEDERKEDHSEKDLTLDSDNGNKNEKTTHPSNPLAADPSKKVQKSSLTRKLDDPPVEESKKKAWKGTRYQYRHYTEGKGRLSRRQERNGPGVLQRHQSEQMAWESATSQRSRSLEHEQEEETISSSIEQQRQKQRSMKKFLWLTLASFWWMILIPLFCVFLCGMVLYTQSKELQPEIASVLTVHTDVMRLLEQENTLLLKLSMFYSGGISQDALTNALDEYSSMATQLYSSFLWSKNIDDSSVVLDVQGAVGAVNDIIQKELATFEAVRPLTEHYYIQQSEYSRNFLPQLTDENGYGDLLPVSVTTSGSAVQTFFDDFYQSTLGNLNSSSGSAILRIFNDFRNICDILSGASMAELNMWNAVITGGGADGVKNALLYSTFLSLVGIDALYGILFTDESSAEAAVTQITDYYEKLLDEASTTEQITELFTTSFTPPTPSNPPVSTDAYFAAAYTASYLSNTTTEAQFASDFAYNRNLIQYSLKLNGQMNLVDALAQAKRSIQSIIQSASSGGTVEIRPASRNNWIWLEEYYFDDTDSLSAPTTKHLHTATLWGSVAVFWVLAIEMVLSYYIIFWSTA